MPTYTVTVAVPSFSAEAKQRIAEEITRTHQEVTGAQRFFAEVIFHLVSSDDVFIAGRPLRGHTVFVNGFIRAGRTHEQKDQLISLLVERVAASIALPRHCVWVYINELPPRLMAEFGHVLPQPGSEASWFEELPDEDKTFLNSIDQ